MAKRTKGSAIMLAAKHGCSLEAEWAGTAWQLLLDAPEGMRFIESGQHVSGSLYGNGFADRDLDWGRVEESILAVVGAGFESCDDPDCDVCSEETE